MAASFARCSMRLRRWLACHKIASGTVEHAAELIMTAAESEEREEIKAATIQLERALKREGML
jgi:hypothetical protein